MLAKSTERIVAAVQLRDLDAISQFPAAWRVDMREQVLAQAPKGAAGYRLVLPAVHAGEPIHFAPRRKLAHGGAAYTLSPFKYPKDLRLCDGCWYRILWVDAQGRRIPSLLRAPVPGLYYFVGPPTAAPGAATPNQTPRMAKGSLRHARAKQAVLQDQEISAQTQPPEISLQRAAGAEVSPLCQMAAAKLPVIQAATISAQSAVLGEPSKDQQPERSVPLRRVAEPSDSIPTPRPGPEPEARAPVEAQAQPQGSVAHVAKTEPRATLLDSITTSESPSEPEQPAVSPGMENRKSIRPLAPKELKRLCNLIYDADETILMFYELKRRYAAPTEQSVPSEPRSLLLSGQQRKEIRRIASDLRLAGSYIELNALFENAARIGPEGTLPAPFQPPSVKAQQRMSALLTSDEHRIYAMELIVRASPLIRQKTAPPEKESTVSETVRRELMNLLRDRRMMACALALIRSAVVEQQACPVPSG